MQDGENILHGTGDDAFLRGVRTWLKARQYSTSTTEQLWQALSSAVGKNVGTWMHGWSYESGFPLVRVTLGGITNRDVSVSQVRGPTTPFLTWGSIPMCHLWCCVMPASLICTSHVWR